MPKKRCQSIREAAILHQFIHGLRQSSFATVPSMVDFLKRGNGEVFLHGVIWNCFGGYLAKYAPACLCLCEKIQISFCLLVTFFSWVYLGHPFPKNALESSATSFCCAYYVVARWPSRFGSFVLIGNLPSKPNTVPKRSITSHSSCGSFFFFFLLKTLPLSYILTFILCTPNAVRKNLLGLNPQTGGKISAVKSGSATPWRRVK